MFEINKAKIKIISWCNYPESGAIDQAVDVANLNPVFHHVALMPDVHQGFGMTIGGVAALKDAISPNMCGVDIACGMMAVKTNLKSIELEDTVILKKIIAQIKRDIPMGFSRQTTDKWKSEAEKLANIYGKACASHKFSPNKNMEISNIYSQLGSLGSGNHFCEIQYDENDNIWIMIHSGSRNIGKQVCDEYNKLALKFCEEHKLEIPNKDLAYFPISSELGHAYLTDMSFCIEFSFKNRDCMISDVMYSLERTLNKKISKLENINIHHNYVALETHFGEQVWVHRKGATSAKKGQLGVIPGSMGSKSYIVSGKGNPESFESCSHGAGRKMSRGKAKKEISLEDFKLTMKNVVSLDVDRDHLDESPGAYKSIKTVMDEQADLVEIVHELSPLANVKG